MPLRPDGVEQRSTGSRYALELSLFTLGLTSVWPFEVALFRASQSWNPCARWLFRARAPARNRARVSPFDDEHEHHPHRRIEHEQDKKPNRATSKGTSEVSSNPSLDPTQRQRSFSPLLSSPVIAGVTDALQSMLGHCTGHCNRYLAQWQSQEREMSHCSSPASTNKDNPAKAVASHAVQRSG